MDMNHRSESSRIAKKIDTVVLNISTELLRKQSIGNKDVGMIGVINMLTEDVGVELEAYGGEILTITRSGISAMFSKEFDKALQCAITLCQEAELEERQPLFKGLSVGIDYGTISVGTVSYKEFVIPIVISEIMETAQFLSHLALNYHSRILVTGSAASLTKDFQLRYNNRRLGRLFHASANFADDIFDVYDGDRADAKYSKMRSRLFFETGVDLFLKGNYLEARSYFIEILKFDRNDAAAKQYVFRCDSCIAGTATEFEKKYLDRRDVGRR